MNTLSFETLREANVLRLPQFKNKFGERAHSQDDGSDWTVSDWIECVTGELGELANLHKKFRRGDVSQREFDLESKKELADIAIYLDILSFQLKTDLGQAIEDKFNEVSIRVNSNITINENKIHLRTVGTF
jgi:NTP pyrophosphatase (non-canonical NTP hydrolase)